MVDKLVACLGGMMVDGWVHLKLVLLDDLMRNLALLMDLEMVQRLA